ncbi:class I SAM-dependent methyltransferase [Thermoanaerobacter brockii subsp. lactiethylicus]|jgi:ubiquinone/menaquinone biosynthesis C-methylase UbiE|uniref:Methyltransferase type 11 n=2 Tax=Thermoanaerobacter TaxID=1754 RepID=B0K7Q2_THEP3|nr:MULTISPECIES: class I SAM-dependent methyltransferase [Thermoanaerobacter]ABY92422.1 Methyltransferase type 11 [Thermoanaerobacter sp. X514]ABY94301.1 Methyltransferase type 11 [Thermoanaerobacter pseudethanolicus ATCC 33223]ADV79250.1 Methyltransferase type 11 [Thermoanaerobacter brockii subsp. finnii Ako-1]HBW60246.1 class I SAM-dependent methyltransferase [Thermoanaerobacter sp.]
MPKISAFEKHFDRYEEWFEKNEYAYQSELDAVKLLMPKFVKGLEIGIGTGRFAVPLNIKNGVEPSSEMRKIALERGLNVVDGVAENLPFEDNSFDLVLMVTTVCFVDDVLKSFKECFRVLKNNGTILIGFVDRESTIGKIYQANKEKSLFYKEATFYSTSEIVELLYEAGFKNFNFSQTIFKKLDEIKEKEPVRYGFGKGSFIVISAKK